MIRTAPIHILIAMCLGAAGPSPAQVPPNPQQEIASHFRQAQEFIKNDKPDLAAREFSAILALDPQNTDARGNLGVLFFFNKEYAKATPLLRETVKQRPDLTRLQALLGMAEKRIGQSANARTDLEHAFPQLEEEKVRLESGMELIELYYAAGELDKAAGIVGNLKQFAPANPTVLYIAHRIYAALADETTLSMTMVAPKSGLMHQLMAYEMARRNNTEGAVKNYREALKIDPTLPGLHFELAEALSTLSGSDPKEVEKQYEAALEVNPYDGKAESRLGEIAARQGDVKKAFSRYSRALELAPNDVDANISLAKLLVAMNQPEKAEPLLRHAIQLDPFNAIVHYRLSLLLRNEGQSEEATSEMAEFRKLKAMKERLTEVYDELRLKPLGRERSDEDVVK